MLRFAFAVVLLCTCLAPAADRPNILLVLADDHRYDAMGFMGHPFLETPAMDRMAREGVHCANAFVTTSLCSPSRASILTGLYAHTHGVVDNYHPVKESLVFFPQLLQDAGYKTAFIGKWHMDETDEPQRGFDHWVAFKGQGSYWPDGRGTTRVVPQTSLEGLNINGKRVPQKGYITDELTDYAAEWIKEQARSTSGGPWMCYVSHKAVHSDFVAADRHKGRYKDERRKRPPTFPDTAEVYRDKPMWLKNQRNSRHGVDYAYNLDNFDLDAYYQRYCETLLAVDDGLGKLLKILEETGQLDNTLVVYMGDNGFQFGEHGLIDKRTAYEASIRVPLLMRGPGITPGSKLEQVVANIDIAPTLLAAAGVEPPSYMQGRSFVPLLREQSVPWSNELLYEYYWERNYPHTPTTHAVRTDRYKYIRYHGVWDIDELYDLKNDPHETRNLIFDPEHAQVVERLNKRLFELLGQTGGESVPLLPDRGDTFPMRHPDRAKQASFPPQFIRK